MEINGFRAGLRSVGIRTGGDGQTVPLFAIYAVSVDHYPLYFSRF
jgi:hypothetical protein